MVIVVWDLLILLCAYVEAETAAARPQIWKWLRQKKYKKEEMWRCDVKVAE